jgi:hypothetical protein
MVSLEGIREGELRFTFARIVSSVLLLLNIGCV